MSRSPSGSPSASFSLQGSVVGYESPRGERERRLSRSPQTPRSRRDSTYCSSTPRSGGRATLTCTRLHEESRERACRLQGMRAAAFEAELQANLHLHAPRPGVDSASIVKRLYKEEMDKRRRKEEEARLEETRRAAEAEEHQRKQLKQAGPGAYERLYTDYKSRDEDLLRRRQKHETEEARLIAERSVHKKATSDGSVFIRLYSAAHARSSSPGAATLEVDVVCASPRAQAASWGFSPRAPSPGLSGHHAVRAATRLLSPGQQQLWAPHAEQAPLTTAAPVDTSPASLDEQLVYRPRVERRHSAPLPPPQLPPEVLGGEDTIQERRGYGAGEDGEDVHEGDGEDDYDSKEQPIASKSVCSGRWPDRAPSCTDDALLGRAWSTEASTVSSAIVTAAPRTVLAWQKAPPQIRPVLSSPSTIVTVPLAQVSAQVPCSHPVASAVIRRVSQPTMIWAVSPLAQQPCLLTRRHTDEGMPKSAAAQKASEEATTEASDGDSEETPWLMI